MDGRLLTRLTNAAFVAVAGMGVAHLVMPVRDASGPGARLAFAIVVVGAGALAGWRERRARENFGDEQVRGAEWIWVASGAGASMLLAALAYWLVHGRS